MALFIRRDEERSQLQTKVTAELQERMRKSAQVEGNDISKTSIALENQHETRGAGVIIAVLVVVMIGVGLYVLWPK